ncbi:UNVERIFIED_ORG: hypothetical protein J2Y77_003002 [Pseudomonas lini]
MVARKWQDALPAIRRHKVRAMNLLLPLHTASRSGVSL